MADARLSMQQLIQQRRRAGLVARSAERELFRANFDTPPEDERHRFLFHVHGNAGVGKTFLIREFEQIARERGALTAYVDESAGSVPEALSVVCRQFAAQGRRLKELDRLLVAHRERRHEAETAALAALDPAPGAGAPSAGSMAVARAGLAGLGLVPGVGAFAGVLDPTQLAQGADRLRTGLSARFRSHEDVQLVLAPESVLTPVLTHELREAASAAPWIVLFFDTYERTAPFLDGWLHDVMTTDRHGTLPATTVVVTAGQRPLEPARWAGFADFTTALLLEPFTEAEARGLLADRGVTAEPVIREVLRLTGGLPVLVSTLARTRPAVPDDVDDPSATAVERFLKWEPDPVRRAVALAGALPRWLDADVFRAAADCDPAQLDELYAWVSTLPFTDERAGRLRYHDVVRAPMLRLQRRRSPRGWAERHRRLAELFRQWREETEAAGRGAGHLWTDEEWRELRLAESYHRLCGREPGALPDFLSDLVDACDEGEPVAGRWVQTLWDAAQDAELTGAAAWGHRLTPAFTAGGTEAVLEELLRDSGTAFPPPQQPGGPPYGPTPGLPPGSGAPYGPTPGLPPGSGATYGSTPGLPPGSGATYGPTPGLPTGTGDPYGTPAATRSQRSAEPPEPISPCPPTSPTSPAQPGTATRVPFLRWRRNPTPPRTPHPATASTTPPGDRTPDTPGPPWPRPTDGPDPIPGGPPAAGDETDREEETRDAHVPWGRPAADATGPVPAGPPEADGEGRSDADASPWAPADAVGDPVPAGADDAADAEDAEERPEVQVTWWPPGADATGPVHAGVAEADDVADVEEPSGVAVAWWPDSADAAGPVFAGPSEPGGAADGEEVDRDADEPSGADGRRDAGAPRWPSPTASMSPVNPGFPAGPPAPGTDAAPWAPQAYPPNTTGPVTGVPAGTAAPGTGGTPWSYPPGPSFPAYPPYPVTPPYPGVGGADPAGDLAPDVAARAHRSRAVARAVRGEYAAAVADLTRALALTPDDPRCLALRGEYLRTLRHHGDALRDLERAVTLDPGYDYAWASLGAARLALGDPTTALAALDRALELNPDYPWALIRRARAWRALGAQDRQLADLDRAVTLQPDSPWAHCERGDALRIAGRDEEALAAYDRALALDPEYASAYASRGVARHNLGRHTDALADLDHALRLNPHYEWARIQREAVRRHAEGPLAEPPA